MKINRYFPPYSNCFSHLFILEFSYKSCLPLWPHLSFKFFSHSMVALSSPHPCYIPDFDSLWLHTRLLCHILLPSSWLWVCGHPQASLLPELLLSLPDSFPKAPVVFQAEYWPLLLEDHFAHTCPVLPNRELLTSDTFQLDLFNLTDAI